MKQRLMQLLANVDAPGQRRGTYFTLSPAEHALLKEVAHVRRSSKQAVLQCGLRLAAKAAIREAVNA